MNRDETTRPGAYRAKQAAEYGTYVAVVPIYHDGARAYNAGDPVPVSNVKRHGYLAQGLVCEVDDPVRPLTGREDNCRLSISCRRQFLILGVYGATEPPTLLGTFAHEALALRGEVIVAHRPDVELAYVRAGRDPSQFVAPVIADADTPLKLQCPHHKEDGHDVHPGRLRTELTKADKAHRSAPWCPIERVEVRG